MLAYLDHLEARGELDLETATEFIVLVAALLELKSRLMLTGDEDEQLLDIEPAEAAEELLTRMLDARRYRSAATHLRELLAAQDGVRFRSAPPPAQLLRARARADRRRARPGGARAGARPAAGDAARDLPAPHHDPAGRRSPSASRTCARCCAAGASPSRRPSATPTIG